MSQKQPGAPASSKNPLGDVSFIRATPTGAFSPLTPSPGREKNTPSSNNPYPHPAVPPTGLSPRLGDGGGGMGWSEREDMLSRELEEAKVRVAQMEKTMRWWSDCTANWRDKWNKARNERNKAREDNRQLRARLDSAVKECTTLKRRLQGRMPADLEAAMKSPSTDVSIDQMGEDGRSLKTDSVKSLSGKDSSSSSEISIPSSIMKSEKEKRGKDLDEKDTDDAEAKPTGVEDRLSVGQGSVLASSPLSKSSSGGNTLLGIHDENANASSAVSMDRVSQLQLQLDAAHKTIQTQTYEKDTLSRTIETLEVELSSLRVKCDEIKQSKQELLQQSTREMEKTEPVVSKMREDHQSELGRLTTDLEDESTKTSSMDRRLTDLRRELERLQAENAAEWQKRERLESDKQSLERENRKLRTQVADLEEQLQRKHQVAAASVDSDLRTLQFDLAEKNKELTELRHTHNKVRKTLSERVTELEHTKRRADQYEAEVKKLRGRVEELKRDLATAEDEVDMQSNSVRRLQRSNDELQEQVDNLTLQVDHLQNRLRRGSQSLPKTRSSSLKSFNMEDSAELADSEDDFEDT